MKKTLLFLISAFLFSIFIVYIFNYRVINTVIKCELGSNGNVCKDAGTYFLKVYRLGGEESLSHLYSAFKYLGKSCDLDSPKGCAVYGSELMKKEGTVKEAEKALQKACNLKNKTGCFGLAECQTSETREQLTTIAYFRNLFDV